jgi:hypothetical protein
MQQFTYRSARSGKLVAGLGIALLVETVGLHILVVGRHPLIVATAIQPIWRDLPPKEYRCSLARCSAP